MEPDTDEELMARAARGDEPSFRLLARRYLPRGLGLARRLIGNEAEAEEIVQEALLRVWTNAPRWRPLAPFRSWYYRIVVNLCLNHRRHPPLAPLESAGDPADPRPDPCREAEDRERDRLVAAAIAALPDRQRAAVILVYQEGLSNAETAAVLATSVSAVETLLVRARTALRRSLATLLEI